MEFLYIFLNKKIPTVLKTQVFLISLVLESRYRIFNHFFFHFFSEIINVHSTTCYI